MISVIVPIFNVEPYLSQCVESILAQTYKDLEIILVDDGSPDQCGAICDSYAKRDHRIRVIHQKNAGVSAARNAGLDIAKGEYIGFVDPDDWIMPTMYEAMLTEITAYRADLAICGYIYYNKENEQHSELPMQETEKKNCLQLKEPKELLDQRETMRKLSDIPPTIRQVVWNKLFRQNILQNIRFSEELHASEDIVFLTEYLLRIKAAICINESLYCNRIRKGSATHGGLSIHDLALSYQAHEYMYKSIVNTYPDLKHYSQAFLTDAFLLKYNEAQRKAKGTEETDASTSADLKQMKRMIRKEGLRALNNSQIYWKTRIRYLLV